MTVWYQNWPQSLNSGVEFGYPTTTRVPLPPCAEAAAPHPATLCSVVNLKISSVDKGLGQAASPGRQEDQAQLRDQQLKQGTPGSVTASALSFFIFYFF